MILGLTGTIGSGKSTALQMFARLGWSTLSADSVCHTIYKARETEFYRSICSRWGDDIIRADGLADTKKIADIVFKDFGELSWLNSQLHPRIKKYAEDFICRHRQHDLVFEIPLLFETGWGDFCDKVLTVWAAWDITIERLHHRGLSEQQAVLRMRQQWPADKKLSEADWGIINNGSAEHLMEQCQYIDKIIRKYND